MSSCTRPDPNRGVFETLLALDGRPVDLDAHLARLHASLASVYPNHPPPPLDVPSESGPYRYETSGTSSRTTGAMRVTVAPRGDGGELRAEVSVREVDPGLVFDPPPVSLRSFAVASGLGAHKWADRSLLEAAQAEIGEDELPLLVDADGAVLEAARANVFVVYDGILATPPLDGRILPGITRARVLGVGAALGIETRQVRLSHHDLLAADEIFLTGSVRGVERVRALDSSDLSARGDIGHRLATALRETWHAALVG